MSIDNNDNIKHDSDDSLDSSPEGEPTSTGGLHDGNTNNAQDSQPIKRKGGRKPVRTLSSIKRDPEMSRASI